MDTLIGSIPYTLCYLPITIVISIIHLTLSDNNLPLLRINSNARGLHEFAIIEVFVFSLLTPV